LQKFITAAKGSYETAMGNPAYLSELAEYGFPQAKIESARGLLESLVSADNAQEAAKGAAARATKDRDDAVAELDAWMSQFRGIAKVATRSRPDLATKLVL
jgi:hypothetical protein